MRPWRKKHQCIWSNTRNTILTSIKKWRNVTFAMGESNWAHEESHGQSGHLDGVGLIQSGLTLTGNDLYQRMTSLLPADAVKPKRRVKMA